MQYIFTSGGVEGFSPDFSAVVFHMRMAFETFFAQVWLYTRLVCSRGCGLFPPRCHGSMTSFWVWFLESTRWSLSVLLRWLTCSVVDICSSFYVVEARIDLLLLVVVAATSYLLVSLLPCCWSNLDVVP
ncbi:hypothetical protein QL285_061613 [Trifolium repens]|nr:hypothetical protein QL285_061613 [Trifolium repens]